MLRMTEGGRKPRNPLIPDQPRPQCRHCGQWNYPHIAGFSWRFWLTADCSYGAAVFTGISGRRAQVSLHLPAGGQSTAPIWSEAAILVAYVSVGLAVYNLHLESRSDQGRREQLAEVLKDARRCDGNTPVVLAGDFNLDVTESTVASAIEARHFRNPFNKERAPTAKSRATGRKLTMDSILLRGPVDVSAARVDGSISALDRFPLSLALRFSYRSLTIANEKPRFGMCLASQSAVACSRFDMCSDTHTFTLPLSTACEPFTELELSCASQLDAVSPFVGRLMSFIAAFRGADGSEADIELALHEAILNAVVHGNAEAPHKRVYVTCRCSVNGEVSITVRDEGQGFDSQAVPDPTTPESRFATRGRGIYPMRTLMDEVSFQAGGRVVHMRKEPNTVPK
jgi:serine/threonine-protein kinase RsbW